MKIRIALALLVTISLLSLTACSQGPTSRNIGTGFGYLNGTIAIGPLCPVERNPPDPNCQPTEETYSARPIAVWTNDKHVKVGEIHPDAKGNYNLQLPTGNYVVDFETQQFGNSNLPANITIKTKETTTLNINIDTGIR